MTDAITEVFRAVVYGILEGITEWLPVSSTGHMILLSAIPGFNLNSKYGSNFWNLFLVIIQLGAICAVIMKYFKRLNPLSRKLSKDDRKSIWKMWLKIIIACIPAGVVGVLLELLLTDAQSAILNSPIVVSITLIAYGIIFIIIERLQKKKEKDYQKKLESQSLPANPYPFKYESTESLSYKTCLFIGLFQMLAIIPGTSRSGITIIAAMLLGASRGVSAEFSFFLSIPIMVGASLVKIISFARSETVLTSEMNIYLSFGIIAAFVVSIFVVKFLLEWVKKHTFEGFGYYRIALGVLMIVLIATNVVQ